MHDVDLDAAVFECRGPCTSDPDCECQLWDKFSGQHGNRYDESLLGEEAEAAEAEAEAHAGETDVDVESAVDEMETLIAKTCAFHKLRGTSSRSDRSRERGNMAVVSKRRLKHMKEHGNHGGATCI